MSLTVLEERHKAQIRGQLITKISGKTKKSTKIVIVSLSPPSRIDTRLKSAENLAKISGKINEST